MSLTLSDKSTPHALMDFQRTVTTINNFYSILEIFSTDPEILEALDNQSLLDKLKEFPVKGLDPRIGVLSVLAVLKCFKHLGHEFDPDTEESKILSLFMIKVMFPEEAGYMLNEDLAHVMLSTGIPEQVINVFEKDITLTFDEDRLLLIELLRSCGVDEKKITKYIVRLHRLMLYIAQADGKVTPEEKEWLDNIMAFKNPEGSFERYGHNPPPAEKENTADKKAADEKNPQGGKPLENMDEKVNPIEELKSLIGLENVKKEVQNIYNLVKIQKLREAKGLKSSKISYHCVFTGNPGTGKTTVARILASIYKELGVLQKGHLVETDRSGLVAEYVGQTAVKTNKVVDSALDGVLFIDEAYALAQGGGSDYGLEAIATLLKRMEDDRDRLVVVIAGYTDEIKNFIQTNPGLQSRFNRYIEFEDYNVEELVQIYKLNLQKYEYQLDQDGEAKLREVITKALDNKDRNFGNARFVRNLFEKTLERQAFRLVQINALGEDDLARISVNDIPSSIS